VSTSQSEGDPTVRDVPWRHFLAVMPTGIWLVTALVSSPVLTFLHSPLAPLPGVATLLFVPGAAVMSSLQTRPATTAGRMVLAVCLSMTAVMVVGGVASILGPHLGVRQPLDALPQSVIWITLAMVVLVNGAREHRDPVTWIFEDVRTSQIAGVLASSVLVLISILGVAQLNRSGNIHLAVFSTVLDVAVLLAGIVGGWKRTSKWPLNTLLYFASLALLLSTSLRGGHLYGWDVQQEFGVAFQTIQAGVWSVPANHDPYASMLSLTVLPAILHSLVKLRLLAFFQLVVPAILALLPVAVFSTIRAVPRWITSGRETPRPGLALAVVVGVIVSSVAFSSQLVSITRQAMALTIVTALVMVLFDRSMMRRPAQITVGILIVAISFTHYTTSYLIAAILLCAWPVGLLWSRGWLGTPRTKIERHRYDVRSRRMINGALVSVALVAALGWNLAITRNSALEAPSAAIASQGVGITASTVSGYLSPLAFERVLVSELRSGARYIVPVHGSASVRLQSISIPSAPGVAPALAGPWNKVSFLATESLWVLLGIALLYGVFRLGRRRSYEYSSDLVGLAITGLLVGAILRFSGTLASFYNPERAAIFTAILLAAPVTLFLDDLVTLLYKARLGTHSRTRFLTNMRVYRVSIALVFVCDAILAIEATGLGALFVGGEPPGSLSARDVNVEQFTVSGPEFASAVWLRNHADAQDIVQSDLYGHLVLLSAPGTYHLMDEIVPPGVDNAAFVYLSSVNLDDHVSQAEGLNTAYAAIYRSNIQFFNHNFYVVFSTGATRIYH